MFLKKIIWFGGKMLFLYFILFSSSGFAQQVGIKKDQYIVSDEQKLQIIVHIWGEVNRPGQYVVQDGTNVLELISLAGGPTEFTNLSNVKLTRERFVSSKIHNDSNQKVLVKKELITINLIKYLEKEISKPIPVLQPGDVIKINKNLWAKWQTTIRVVSQIAIVIQAMYFYSRID